MADILIRGLSDETLSHLTAEARKHGLSRNEYLRRRLEQDVQPSEGQSVTDGDWSRLAHELADLADDDIMSEAWR